MAGRDQSFRLGRIAAQHPRLLAVSSAVAVAGLSVTERLIRQRSAERSLQNRRAFRVSRDFEVPAEPIETLGAAAPNPVPAGDIKTLGEAVGPPADPEIKRIYRQGRQALRQLMKKPDDEHWHELGKRSQDLWHGAKLLEASRPKRWRKLARRAHRLSSLLGDDRDLALLSARVREDPARLEPADLKLIHGLIDRRRGELHRKASRLADGLYRRKPRKFARRLGLS